MTSIGATRLREKLAGVLLALYVLSGRWGVERLFAAERPDADASPLLLTELRYWIVLALLGVSFVERGSAVALGARTGVRGFSLALFLLFIYQLLSALWSPDGAYALIKVVDVLLIGFAALAVHKLVTGSRAPEVREYFWKAVFAVTGALAVLALYKAALEGAERLAVLGGGPNVFGRLMGLLCLAGLFFWRRGAGPVAIAAAVLASVLVVLTGSRGCFVALLAAVAAFFLVERVKLRRLAVFGVVAGVLGVGVFTATPVGQRAIATYENRINRLLLQERYTAGRGDLYQVALDMGLERPVFGHGLNAFRALGYGSYCHNFLLELFSEGGAAALALFAGIFALFLRRCATLRAALDGTTAAAFLFILSAGQFSGDLYDNRAVFVFMAMAFLPRDAGG